MNHAGKRAAVSLIAFPSPGHKRGLWLTIVRKPGQE
jgi:hypothetical protein